MNDSRKDSPPCILVVDDDGDWRTVMRDTLFALWGSADIHEASDGRMAMEYLNRRGEFADAPRPDVIYLDLEMPDLSGPQTLRLIRSDPNLKDIPVVMVTGLTRFEQTKLTSCETADGFVTKSSDPAELLERLTGSVAQWYQHGDDIPSPADLNPEKAAYLPPATEHRTKGKGPKILIVEDDVDQRELISEVLCIHFNDPQGRNIAVVGTGEEALREDLSSFDVILLDYYLPDKSGLKVQEEILSQANVPIIFVTGANDTKTAAAAIRAGAQDYIVKLGDYLFALPIVVEKNIHLHEIKNDNERLQAKLKLMLQELKLKNLQLEQSLRKQRRMARTDPLTHLANRRSFSELLELYHSDATRYEHDLSCCMCDLDDFKKLNDVLGHQLGDKVLIMTAEVIRDSVRKSDVTARYGGDEFVVLFPHTSIEGALAVAERIRRELAFRTQKDSELKGAITVSVGVASLSSDSPDTGDSLVSMADKALYAAKDRGKNQTTVFKDIDTPGKKEAVPTSKGT